MTIQMYSEYFYNEESFEYTEHCLYRAPYNWKICKFRNHFSIHFAYHSTFFKNVAVLH